MSHAITVTHEVPDEFLEDVLTTAIETGYDWFAFRKVKRHPEGHDRYLSATSCDAIEVDCDGDGSHLNRTAVDLAKVCEGISKILDRKVALCGTSYSMIADAVANKDAGMIDADLADCILQAACFDEIRYG